MPGVDRVPLLEAEVLVLKHLVHELQERVSVLEAQTELSCQFKFLNLDLSRVIWNDFSFCKGLASGSSKLSQAIAAVHLAVSC